MYFWAPVPIWEQLRVGEGSRQGLPDVGRSIHAFWTLFIGCSFILSSLPPTLPVDVSGNLNEPENISGKICSVPKEAAKHWDEWAASSQSRGGIAPNIYGIIKLPCALNLGIGEASSSHQPQTSTGIYQSRGPSQTGTWDRAGLHSKLRQHNSPRFQSERMYFFFGSDNCFFF